MYIFLNYIYMYIYVVVLLFLRSDPFKHPSQNRYWKDHSLPWNLEVEGKTIG